MKKLVLFTFDYELFLGTRSGQPKDCILEPTNRLLELLYRRNFKGIFFVDTVYLLQLKKIAECYPQAKEDYNAIIDQLILMSKQGHSIFPHIHPHWLDANYLPEKNEWSLENTRYYRFSSLSFEQRRELFDGSMGLLKSLVSQAGGKIPIDGYRAGGWSIQPLDNFKPFFNQYGIHHEFSVIPGRYQSSDTHYFDFRSAPFDQPVYRFNNDVCLQDDSGIFTEWTISVFPVTNFEKWFDFKISGLMQRLRVRDKYKGKTVEAKHKIEGDIYDNENLTHYIASFEGLNRFRVIRYAQVIKKKRYFQFISHPKLLSNSEFRMVALLFKYLSRDKVMETDFKKWIFP
jgi:hypothetical protein